MPIQVVQATNEVNMPAATIFKREPVSEEELYGLLPMHRDLTEHELELCLGMQVARLLDRLPRHYTITNAFVHGKRTGWIVPGVHNSLRWRVRRPV
jgi:hypothetical protein